MTTNENERMLNLILDTLHDIQQDIKNQGNNLNKIETRLTVVEVSHQEQEKYNNMVNELYEWRHKYLGLHTFLLFLIPTVISIVAIIWK